LGRKIHVISDTEFDGRIFGDGAGPFGVGIGFAVIRAVPLVAVLVTLLDVVVRDVDPAEEDVPTVLFPAKDAEA
jgi:hypothetical protein